MYEKRDACAELLFCSLNLLLFWRSRCRRRRLRSIVRSLFRVPTTPRYWRLHVIYLTVTSARCTMHISAVDAPCITVSGLLLETCWSQSVVWDISLCHHLYFLGLSNLYGSFFYFFRLKTIRIVLVWRLWGRFWSARTKGKSREIERRDGRLSRVSRARALQRRGYKALCFERLLRNMAALML